MRKRQSITGLDQARRVPSSLEVGRAVRALVQLAALAGLVDAVGVLAFGHVVLTSPGANLQGGYPLALFACAMVLSFLGGIVMTTLSTYRITRLRRMVILLATALALAAAYGAFREGKAFALAILLAMAMGGVHCIFDRDNPELPEALSPSGQLARFGETLAGGRAGTNHRQIGLHASFWLAFVMGGIAGASAWMALDGGALVLAASIAGLLTLRTWLIERDLLAA
ncbi:DUF1275 family protein [Sphingopyxis sp. GW247-27LB]|uniref:DUF1275 family protein n=1 Tax=Sphingopyxis sp. GW247-27LB TaxID=2012632 RepID=UPI0020D061CA|nr:DUF1275 family protein [Sphingopyxis sp. GW247-27LB]